MSSQISSLEERQAALNAIWKWWKPLADHETSEARAARAQLRRADPLTALQLSATRRLYQALWKEAQNACNNNPHKLVALATTLALIKKDTPQSVAQLMGAEKGNSAESKDGSPPKHVVSLVRFDKIIRADGPTQLALHMRRTLPLIKFHGNIRKLAQDLLFWNDTTRMQWSMDYYNYAPEPTSNDETLLPNKDRINA